MTDQAYVNELEQWRVGKEPELRNEDGWLALAGLFPLHEGSNTFGSDPSNEIVLTEGKSPASAGHFEFAGTETTLHLLPGVAATINGEAVTAPVTLESGNKPTLVNLGPLIIQVIRRARRYLVRVHDRTHPAREAFQGRRWYPADPAWRIEARFVAHEDARSLDIDNTYGDTMQVSNPGYALFDVNGQEVKLEALNFGYTMRFIVRDGTSGHSTYGAGRFLDTDAPKDGKVVLDFNRAYSPPCAFTAYATCPLPPPQNRLKIPIEAGEMAEAH